MPDNPNKIQSVILSSEDKIVSLASEMIEIPSPTGQEGKMAAWLMEWLRLNNFKIESFEIDPDAMEKTHKDTFFRWYFPYTDRPNILGKLKGTGNGKSLMINFHLDVVDASAADWSVNPWKGTVKGDALFGRGACDMKGGAAAALFAIKTISDLGIRLKGDVLVAGVIEEEGPGNGTLALQANGIKADACIIPEPTSVTMAVGVTGGIYGFINLTGKSAHSTTPWNGVNAVEKAFHIQNGLESWKKKRKPISIDPLFVDEPEILTAAHIVSIDRTDGGLVGKIPSSACVMVRATVMPGEDPDEMITAFEKIILTETIKDPWLEKHPPIFTWIKMEGRNRPAELSRHHPLSRCLKKSYETIMGAEPKYTGLVSPADMQQLMNIEPTTPTLMFGPGSIYQAHTDDEFVPIKELVQTSAVIADFIVNWCEIS
jgi:acetylornithine deacetylase